MGADADVAFDAGMVCDSGIRGIEVSEAEAPEENVFVTRERVLVSGVATEEKPLAEVVVEIRENSRENELVADIEELDAVEETRDDELEEVEVVVGTAEDTAGVDGPIDNARDEARVVGVAIDGGAVPTSAGDFGNVELAAMLEIFDEEMVSDDTIAEESVDDEIVVEGSVEIDEEMIEDVLVVDSVELVVLDIGTNSVTDNVADCCVSMETTVENGIGTIANESVVVCAAMLVVFSNLRAILYHC